MKKQTAWLLISIICIALINPTAHCEARYDRVWAYQGEVAMVRKDGLYGLIDKSGELVLPIKYKSLSMFQYGFAYVKDEEDKYGIVNDLGILIVPAEYYKLEFQLTAKEGREGFIIYTEFGDADDSGMYMPGRSGMMDTSGNKLTKAMYDEYVLCPNTPYTNVKSDGKWNTLNKKGELLYTIWMDTMEINEAYFGEPSVTSTIGDVNYRFTYDDRKIYIETHDIGDWEWEQTAVYDGQGNRIALESGYKFYALDIETEFVVYEYMNKAGARDNYGNELIPIECTNVSAEYINGGMFFLAQIRGEEYCEALYDAKGKLIIPPIYRIWGVDGDEILVATKGYEFEGRLRTDGSIKIKPEWNYLEKWKEEDIPECAYYAYNIREDGYLDNYALDEKGNVIKKIKYAHDWAGSSDNEQFHLFRAYVYSPIDDMYVKEWIMKDNNLNTIYRLSDDVISESTYTHVESKSITTNGTWVFRNNGKNRAVGIITREGQIVTNNDWHWISDFDYGKAFVMLTDGQFIAIDENGNTLFTPQLTLLDYMMDYLVEDLQYKLYGDTVAAYYNKDYINEEGLCFWSEQ